MSCSIEGDGSGPSFWDVSYIVKCKKQHTCIECGHVIEKGGPYVRIKGVWDGEFSTFKQCMDCNSAFQAFGQPSFGHLWPQIVDTLHYCNADVDYNTLERLTPRALHIVLEHMQNAIDLGVSNESNS